VPELVDVDTPVGAARLHLREPRRPSPGGPVGTLVLGHGAGGGVQARDLVAVASAVTDAGWRSVLVEQPWKVAGKRVAPPPPRLDAAWLPIMERLREHGSTGGALVVGGRSAGARVACRTAVATGAVGVVCLAFPLHPPGRPERSRLAELLGAGVPTLVVQGERDPFGGAEELSGELVAAAGSDTRPADIRVVGVAGDHGLAAGVRDAAAAVVEWLSSVVVPPSPRPS
jgi:predicted alpha/beta-hydrolase family hydrolase